MSTDTGKPSSTMRGKIVETIGDIVVAGAEATAQISLGQGLLRLVDNFLWVVEKSAQWSLPVQEVNTEENGKSFGNAELVRPLPWIFFLPSLVMLRVCRFGINVGAVILGYPKLQATGMVKAIQKGRRRLRAIRSNAIIKNMRCRKNTRNKDEELNEAKKSLIKSMLSTLSALSCLEASRRTPSPPPTRIYVQHNEADANQTPDEESTTESASPQVDPKRKYSQIVVLDDSSDISEEESTKAQLERLAAEDSDADDRDFDPAEEELAGSESSSTDEDGDVTYVSDTEIMELRNPPEMNTTVILSEGTILEEPKPEVQPEEKTDIEEMNKMTTPIKTSEGKMPDSSQPTGKETADNAALTPVTPRPEGEHKTKSYLPLSSSNDSIKDVKSPVSNDAKKSTKPNDSNQSIPATALSPQIGNGDLDSSVASTISGNSTEGGTPTNGEHSTDEKRNNASGKSHHKGKRSGLALRKKK